jgi:hypothetical protein
MIATVTHDTSALISDFIEVTFFDSCIKQRDRVNIKQKYPSFIPPVQVCRSHQRVQRPFSSFALPNVAPLALYVPGWIMFAMRPGMG